MAVLLVALPAAGDTPSQRSNSRATQAAAGKLPPNPSFDDIQDQAFPVQQTTGSVSKAKVSFTFPDVYMRAYLLTCFGDPLAGWFGTEYAQRTCPALSRLPLPPKYQNGQTIAGGAADVYIVASHRGRNARNTYGSLPPVKVRSLVFGSIPVSATVQLSQTVTDGYIDPIKAVNANVTLPIPNEPMYPGFPNTPSDVNTLTFKNTLDATLQLRLSDVAVDGRRVEVGPRCTTVSPVRLTVRGAQGYWNDRDPAQRARGLPGGFLPLEQNVGAVPGYFDGNVDVPAFAHCGSATEDLDPLLTALISSPRNSVSAYLPVGISVNGFCGSPVTDNSCPANTPLAQRRMNALALAIQQHKSTAELRKLQAKMKASDYVLPKVKAG